MLQNAVVLYRCTITFSNMVSTNHKIPRLCIPTVRGTTSKLAENFEGVLAQCARFPTVVPTKARLLGIE